MNKEIAAERLEAIFGTPLRDLVKVKSWNANQFVGVVLQVDQPNARNEAFIWLPYPEEGGIPEIALEYAGETGRHSGTYASPGLEKGKPALKVIVHSSSELEDTISYILAIKSANPLPSIRADQMQRTPTTKAARDFPTPDEPKTRREAIPRSVQREVWQRDGGRCVECSSRELLCFDHIVPFSRGGSNTVRNIQLLCERCNLSKGNRI
jgi:hypothetical protein